MGGETLEEKRFKPRTIPLLILVVLIFGGFVARLIEWQIFKGDYYFEISNQNNSYTLSTEAVRGEILDVNGVSLAVNFPVLKIYFDRFTMDPNNLNLVILNLIDLFELKGEKWIDELPIEIDGFGNYAFIKDKEEEIKILKSKKVLNMNDYATAKECMDKLVEKYKCGNRDKVKERKVASVRYNMTKTGYDNSYTLPYTFAEAVSSEIVSIVLEDRMKFPGVQVLTSVTRKDVNGTIAPHIVGIVGALSQEDYERLKDKGYKLNDRKGNSGIERAMESYLRGKGGKKTIEATREGTVMNVLETQNAIPGNTIYLTIDARLQKVANESLAKNVKASEASDCIAGGVVVMNVNDFSILAASTYPSYDLTKFLDDYKYFNEVMSDDKKKPTLDRALMGAFTPGSIFKPAVACAGLQEGVITENENIYCPGYFSLGDARLGCKTGPHAGISVKGALAYSCNVFFAETGRRLGVDPIKSYCNMLGLGVDLGLEIPTTEGRVAETNAFQAGIGQSDSMFSPLQLATYTATIANGGNRYQPHLVRKITDYNREKVIEENDPNNPKLVDILDVSTKNLDIVKQGMRQVALSGTASSFANYEIPIAAKTGTAENSGSDHTTFICFAPYEKPEIAIAVVIEHGANGTLSKGVAKDILDAYFFQKGLEEIPPVTSFNEL